MSFIIKTFICGILTSLLFPPFFLIPLGFVIFPYLFYLIKLNIKKYNFKIFFFSGFFYGIGFFSFFLSWVSEPFFLNENTKGYAFFSYILIIYCSFYFGLIFYLIKFFNNIFLRLLMFPALIVLGEFICANLYFGFPWFSFALINSNNFFGTSLVYFIGSYGLSYITISIFLLPSIYFFEHKKNYKLVSFFYFFLFIIIFLLISTKFIQSKNENLISTSILLVQMNLPANEVINLENKNKKLKKIINIIEETNKEIIIFAENDYPYLMDQYHIGFLQNHLSDKQKLIIGSIRTESNNYYNSLFLISKNKYEKFDKKILVPYGEFIPFRAYFEFMEYIAGSIDFSEGRDNRFIELDENINLLPVICYEILFFWDLIKDKNFNLIVNITNDSWFGDLLGPYQHFYFTKLRAAEFNKPIIRVSSNGISALINKNGVIKDFLKLNDKDFLNIDLIDYKIQKNYILFHKLIFLLIILSILLCFVLNKKNE